LKKEIILIRGMFTIHILVKISKDHSRFVTKKDYKNKKYGNCF